MVWKMGPGTAIYRVMGWALYKYRGVFMGDTILLLLLLLLLPLELPPPPPHPHHRGGYHMLGLINPGDHWNPQRGPHPTHPPKHPLDPWDEQYVYLHHLNRLNVGKYTLRPMDPLDYTS